MTAARVFRHWTGIDPGFDLAIDEIKEVRKI